MSADKERLAWPDLVKGIGILTIILGHTTMYFPEIGFSFNRFGRSFALPLFLLWAGASSVMWPGKYDVPGRDFYSKRIKRYLIPYVFFSLFNSALKLGVLLLTHELTAPVFREEMRALLLTGNGTVWFLITIFLVEIIFYETKKSPYLRVVFLVLGLVLPFQLSPYTGSPIVLLLARTALAFSYFMLGYILWGRISPRLDDIPPRSITLSGLFMIVLGYIASQCFDYQIEFFFGEFLNGLIAVPVSILISFGIIFFCYSIRDRRNRLLDAVQYFGRESMLVMLLHPTILLFFTYPFGSWFVSLHGIPSFIAAIAVFTAVTILNIPFILIINRWLPFLKGGKRR